MGRKRIQTFEVRLLAINSPTLFDFFFLRGCRALLQSQAIEA